MNEINAIITIAFRDVLKFMRDRPRIIATFVFPVIFIGALGGGLQASFGASLGFNYLAFIFTGVYAQTLFQSSAAGIISLIEDRENDFSREIFIAPISRYSIILGKILGESLVAMIQGIGIIIFAVIIRIPATFEQLIILVPIGLAVCLFGAAFGIVVMSQLNSQRAANQIFPFLLFPQFFLSGVFNPVKELPWYLLILSRISPMTYAVDFIRSIFYSGKPENQKIVINSSYIDMLIIVVLFFVFVSYGTVVFVKRERNK